MSNQEATPATAVVVVKEESFLNDKIDLTSLRLALKRNSPKAIETILAILDDEKASPTLKYQAAAKLLDLQVQVAATISKDQIQRLVAELKLRPNGRTPMTDGSDEDDDLPSVDFDTIRQVG